MLAAGAPPVPPSMADMNMAAAMAAANMYPFMYPGMGGMGVGGMMPPMPMMYPGMMMSEYYIKKYFV